MLNGRQVSLIVAHLERLACIIDNITSTLLKVREGCDREVFYHRIRPWLNGGALHPCGWQYEGVEASDAKAFTSLGGATAAQSTLIHALNIFLGIEHSTDRKSSEKPSMASPPSSTSFLQTQKLYMPGPHRAFLEDMASFDKTIKSVVKANPDNNELLLVYNAAVGALKRFREAHIRIVTLYVVSPSRTNGGGAVKGSGGSLLVPLLKEAKDNTVRAII